MDIASIARLSHKYDMDEIFDETTKRMQPFFLDTFAVWDKNGPLRGASMPREHSDSVEAINLFCTL